jgi:hypothetical protein
MRTDHACTAAERLEKRLILLFVQCANVVICRDDPIAKWMFYG